MIIVLVRFYNDSFFFPEAVIYVHNQYYFCFNNAMFVKIFVNKCL